MSLGAQRTLAAITAELGGITDAARDAARASLIDTLAVAFAGRAESVNARAAAYSQTYGEGARAWLTGSAYPPETAALLNAVAAHALDYDDVTPAWRGHPGSVLWPALCASAKRGSRLANLLDAFVVGIEVGARLSHRIASRHYAAGWHATATIGVIAAAAACCRLRGVNAAVAFHAIGLAAAQSSGIQASFGSMAKPLQAGFAASAGVRAASLAMAGVTCGDVLEGPTGFASLYAGVNDLGVSAVAPDDALAILRPGIEVKQFPNCYATHRAVEAALALRNRVGENLHEVEAIAIEGTPTAHRALVGRRPGSVDEARFSAEFAVACALADARVSLSSFTEAQLHRTDIARLMALARTSERMDLAPVRAARVAVRMRDGRLVEHTVTDLEVASGNAAFLQRLQWKVVDCMSEAGLAVHAQALYNSAWEIEAGTPEYWAVLQNIWKEEA